MVQVNQPAPDFKCTAIVDGRIKEVSLSAYTKANHWVILLFFPRAWSLICPTEICAFSARLDEFLYIRSCGIVFVSTDSEFCLKAWNATSELEGGLGGVHVPLISDKTHSLSKAYNVLVEAEGAAQRALFVIDPKSTIRAMAVNDDAIGRSVDETQRLLDALIFKDEFGEGCSVDWKKGDKGVDINNMRVEGELALPTKKTWSEWARPKLQRGWSGTSHVSTASSNATPTALHGRVAADRTSMPLRLEGGNDNSFLPVPGSPLAVAHGLSSFPFYQPSTSSQGAHSPVPSIESANASVRSGRRTPEMLSSSRSSMHSTMERKMEDVMERHRAENRQAAMSNQGVGMAS